MQELNVCTVGTCRVVRDFFIILLFFNSHDSMGFDGFNKSLPCCNCLLYAVSVHQSIQKLMIMVGELIFSTARHPIVFLLIKLTCLRILLLFWCRKSLFLSKTGK